MFSVVCYSLDLLAVQRSLAELQERFNDLHENAESRFVALVAERDVQAKEKEEAEQALEECRQQLKTKVAELQSTLIERDERADEKEEVCQALEVSRQELEVKVAELQSMSRALDAQEDDKEGLRQQLEQVSMRLAQKEAEAQAATEQAELVLLQLHQVQEELEHYFLLSRRQSKTLDSSQHVCNKAVLLALKLSQ